jgi:hypothetical protein
MHCEERVHLIKLCAITMRAYTKASIKWQKLTGEANTQAYRDALAAREQARTHTDLANYELEEHERQHKCYPPTTPK